MRMKSLIEKPLRRFGLLHRWGSRLYYKLNRGLVPLCPEAPAVLERALRLYRERCGGEGRDYYEFGLFRGFSFLSAQSAADRLQLNDLRYYGFDSFQGLPKVEGIDEANSQFFEGQFACSQADVARVLSQHGFDWSRARLIQGFFDQSLTEELRSQHPFRQVAVALIDCDLYSSTRDVLAWLCPYLEHDSILLFDDWRSFGASRDLGQPKAFEEFLRGHPEFRAESLWSFPNHGEAFLLCRS